MPMPITGVTLYDNGYAVFEREATVHGNGQIDLYFPSELMKSVLESLEFLALSTVDAIEQRRGAVIIVDEVEVRSALGPSGMSLFVLHSGAEVAIEDSTPTHRLLLLSDGRKGWVHADVLLSVPGILREWC